MSTTYIMHGAEPVSIAKGSCRRCVLLHGYTATPQQLRTWAMAFAQAGFAVEVPLLPGHGTVPDELVDTDWSDYAVQQTPLQKTPRCVISVSLWGDDAQEGISLHGLLYIILQRHPA